MFLGRVVKPGEPQWLPEDREWALALLAEEGDTCTGCGQPLSETFDPANAEAYTVDAIGICAGCYVLEAAARDRPDNMRYRVRRRTNVT